MIKKNKNITRDELATVLSLIAERFHNTVYMRSGHYGEDKQLTPHNVVQDLTQTIYDVTHKYLGR